MRVMFVSVYSVIYEFSKYLRQYIDFGLIQNTSGQLYKIKWPSSVFDVSLSTQMR